MVKVKRGEPLKNKYEMKTPKVGQRELVNSKKALRLLKNLKNYK